MGFRIFMFLTVILIPAVMIFFGRKFIKNAPEDINYLFGYRTTMSMKNKNTWDFAHKHFGKIWYILGFVVLIISATVFLIFIGADKNTVGSVGCTITLTQCVVMILPIFSTEKALRKSFDKDGNKK